jgi:transposase
MQLDAPDSLDADHVTPLVLQLLARIDAVLEQNKCLLARIAELEARLNIPPKTPDNSSLPPSKGQKPNTPPSVKKPRKGRPGVARALCPEPDVVRNLYAGRCACGHQPAAAEQPDVHAYDHIDLPPIKPVTTRINLHSGSCSCCGQRVAAEPPADMPLGSPFGPGIASHVVYLHATQMVSYSRLVNVMQGLFGLTISEGAIANMLARAAKPFAQAATEIAEAVRAAPVIASDETSARVEGKTCWQWVFATAMAVLHLIAPSRGKAVVTTFLDGAQPQVWVSDRLGSQMGHGSLHQVCLAHLLRDAQFAIDAGDTVFAPGFKGLLKRACAIGRRRDELADKTLKSYARDLERRLDNMLQLEPKTAAGWKLLGGIIKCRANLFVFVARRDVPPTNNVSERALRPSVIFRKVTNGFRSTWGSQVYADICSVIATGKLNGRTALASIRATLAGTSVLKPA